MQNSHMKYMQDRDQNPLVPGHFFLFSWIKPYIKKQAKILDIGCWTGALELLFEKEDCQLSGIDIEEEPLFFARKRFKRFRFIKGSVIDPLPFKKKEFGIVLYFMVIEHIPRGMELRSLKNINKVMKKNGQLFINTMLDNPISNLLDPAYFFGHRHYSKKRLISLLRQAGFKPEEIKYNGGFFTTLHIFLLYFFKHILRRKEPRNKFLDSLMKLDYRDKGFVEIDIRAVKVKDL